MDASEFGGLVDRLKDTSKFVWRESQFPSSVVLNSQYDDREAAGHSFTHFVEAINFPAFRLEGLRKALKAATGFSPALSYNQHGTLKDITGHEADGTSANKLDDLTRNKVVGQGIGMQRDPAKFQFWYFPGADNLGHGKGGPGGTDIKNVMKGYIKEKLDAKLIEVGELVEKRGYESAILHVVAADHGLIGTPSNKAVLAASNTVANGKISRAPNPESKITKHLQALYEQTDIVRADGSVGKGELWIGGIANVEDSAFVHSPNGGLAHVYIQGKNAQNEPSWSNPASEANVRRIAEALYQEDQNTTHYDRFKDSLAKLGKFASGKDRRGLLVRYAVAGNYRHYHPKNPGDMPAEVLAETSPTGATATMQWTDVVRRIDDEMNDLGANSRSGDIVLLMNTQTGVTAVAEPDAFPGWHGAATKAESECPMVWNFLPAKGPDDNRRSDLLDIIETELGGVHGTDLLRTLHLKQALSKIYEKISENTFGD